MRFREQKMLEERMQLPYTPNLEIQYLSRLFDNMSESYKIFWFQAIVKKIMDGKTTLSYEEIIDEMVADAWYMVSEYKLNLGPSDTLEALVRLVFESSGFRSSEKKEKIISFLKSTKDREIAIKKRTLTKYVPYRLQAPFMEAVRGEVWKASERMLAEKINEERRLIYYFSRITGMQSEILIQEDWADYIRKNAQIILGWIQYNMIMYLQRRNPDVPGIASKIYPPQAQKLQKITKYWRLIIDLEPTREIFAGDILTAEDLSIDHFVPWSYVAHDEFWNLHPTTKSINSSKSSSLPVWDKYFPRFCGIEYQSYEMMNRYEKVREEFEKCRKEHINNPDILAKLYRPGLEREEFDRNLEGVLLPVYQSAKNMGFRDWEYK